MSIWKEVRRLARKKHDEIAGFPADLIASKLLLEGAEKLTEISVKVRPAGDPLLDGAEAAYDKERKKIYYSASTPLAVAQFHIAHEFAHHWLEEVGASCSLAELDPMVPAEPEMSCVGDQDSYSPKERAEAQANLFAREFLVPRDKLKRRCERDGIDADRIADELGVTVDLVMQQLADALLLPPESDEESVPRVESDPDRSQNEAITAGDEPRLVRAGPGTGKTRTLVGRVKHLIQRGESPSTILALTYSNLSAQDLATRIRNEIGEAATHVWSGTFHAYGLELLRKYGHVLGFEGEPKLLDRTDCLVVLERLLPQLDLNHYLELHEPILKLRSILGAIGRAKDEIASPEDYMRCATSMREEARDDIAIEKAEKAIEVARVYDIYQAELRNLRAVDFGDLVALPVKLLRENREIREEIQNEKRHILVDEYQDMNRASALLLRELCVVGRGPWVVGDVRQSIYRFRGASPTNMTRFPEEFPGAKGTDLEVNYRSGGKIVRAFESFGQTMAVGAKTPTPKLTAFRGDEVGEINYNVAKTREAEAHGIAKAILARVNNGLRFADHTVLARSHTVLSRLATELEASGVPCLYFGDFFERPEIRDLLSVLSVASEPKGVGLLRVAQLPAYAVPVEDIRKLIAWRRQQELTMMSAIKCHKEVAEISAAAHLGFSRLVSDLQDSGWTTSPHKLLISYLFRRSGYLLPLIQDDSIAGQQRRLAIYQLLQFAFAYKSNFESDPKRSFLSHIRRLELLDEEKQLRQLPAAVSDIDAVRLMTVHSSKGLEFPVVHLASLTSRNFPSPNRHDPCPLPDGLISTDAIMTSAAEEDSLFFVALSRAKDVLHLTRAETNGKQSAGESRFIKTISSHLPRSAVAAWSQIGNPPASWPSLLGREDNSQWKAREIETYLECPRRYYYEHVLELGGSDSRSPFLKFQSALHSSMAWMRGVDSHEERVNGLAGQFTEDWQKFGPKDDPLEEVYRRIAFSMLENAVSTMNGNNIAAERELFIEELGVTIKCRADQVHQTPKGVVFRRLKAGRLAKKESEKARYNLLYAAIQADHPDDSIHFEHVSLQNGERRPQSMSSGGNEKTMTEIREAIISAGDGKFDPIPSARNCPSCAFFFICPSHAAIK